MLSSLLRQEPILWPLLVLLAIIYIIPQTPLGDRIDNNLHDRLNQLPEIKVDFHPSRTFRNRFSNNRTALYIETRDEVKHATPLLLHMTQVIPPEWRFVFLGTEKLVDQMSQSSAIQRMIEIGKLRLGYVERWTYTWKDRPDIFETQSRLLTNSSFYEEQFPGVEWMLYFRSSAIVCANAKNTVNDYLQYDWIGAPWNLNDKFGGNGGLSIRRIPKVQEILKFQTRVDNSEHEDRWLSKRIGLLPQSHCANGTVEHGFSVEDIWHDSPLGYHINPHLPPNHESNFWHKIENRKKVYDYCPEIKMIMRMRLERERCKETEALAPAPAPGRKLKLRDLQSKKRAQRDVARDVKQEI